MRIKLTLSAYRGVPVQRYTRQQSVIAYWGMGLYWGRALSQNKKGHLLGHVKVGVSSCHRQTASSLQRQSMPCCLGSHTDFSSLCGVLQFRLTGAVFAGRRWPAFVMLREGFLTKCCSSPLICMFWWHPAGHWL